MHGRIVFFCIALLTLLSIAGCSNGYRQQLNAINQQIEKGESDSALHQLSALEHRHLSDEDRALCHLLIVKTMYRLYRVLPTDSLINNSIATFRFLGNDSLLADAYYYKAAMASDREKDKGYIKVMGCLRAAERIAVQHHYVELEKKIYDRASNYNIVAEEYEKALYYAKKQQALVSMLNDNYFKAYATDQLLKAYFMLGEKDSVRKYHRQCWNMRKYIPAEEMPDYLNDLYVTMELIDRDRAIACFEDLIRKYPSALYQGNLACLYDKAGQRAKADSLWGQALRTGSLFAKSGVLIDMIHRKQADGLYQEAMKAQGMLNAVNDSLEQQYRSDDMGDVVEDSTSELYHGVRARNVVVFFSVIAFILVLSAVAISLYHHKLHKRNLMFYELADELSKTRGNMEESLQKEQDKVNMLEEALDKLKEEHSQTFSHGRQLYEEIKAGRSVSLWKKQDFIDFIDYYMSVDFKFLQTLHDNYKGLTPSEIFFLILFHEGYDDAATKNILAVSNTALRVRKSRINKKKLNKDA